MEQLNLVATKEVYDEKDIIVKYRTKRGIQTISVEAKFHVTVNVVLGVNVYCNIAMGPGDRLDFIEEKLRNDPYGVTNYSYASFHTLRSNLLTQLDPNEVSQRNDITTNRVIVEWDHYDPYEDIVVEGVASTQEVGEQQVTFEIYHNNRCINGRNLNGLSIDLAENEESVIIKLIRKLSSELKDELYGIAFEASDHYELSVWLWINSDEDELKSLATTINVDTNEVTELVLSDDEVESTKFLDLLKTIDLTAILRELNYPSNNPVKSLLAIK